MRYNFLPAISVPLRVDAVTLAGFAASFFGFFFSLFDFWLLPLAMIFSYPVGRVDLSDISDCHCAFCRVLHCTVTL
jgi:hypothetical protein